MSKHETISGGVKVLISDFATGDTSMPVEQNAPAIRDRLRNVLSDKDRELSNRLEHCQQRNLREPAKNAERVAIVQSWAFDAVLPLLSSLLEEREREIREGLKVIYTALRSDEKGEHWAVRRWLDKQGLFNGDLNGERCVELATKHLLSRLASSSSPAAPQEQK